MGRGDTGEIVKRALAYPYRRPAGSFLHLGGEFRELPGELELHDRTPPLALWGQRGTRGARAQARRLPDRPLPILLASEPNHELTP